MPTEFPNIAVVVEIPGDRSGRTLHTFVMPTWKDKGHHRAITSFESFKRGPPPKNKRDRVPWNHPQFPGKFKSPAWRRDRWFYTQHHTLDDFLDNAERNFTSFERMGLRPSDERIVTIFHHDDLWAFYNHIGWDYKARAYREAS